MAAIELTAGEIDHLLQGLEAQLEAINEEPDEWDAIEKAHVEDLHRRLTILAVACEYRSLHNIEE